MQCYVYKGDKEDHYLFLAEPLEELEDDVLPAALVSLLGDMTLVVEFDLAGKSLAQADPEQVEASIRDNGFYLQMPKKDMRLAEDQYFN
ncbi:MAG: hypothetical protein HKN50_10540 [Gammaproteobacteria bacterium]|nr:hypothetical protein [Gammaproteobacteria bacterium]